MTAALKAAADGLSASIQVGGSDKLTITSAGALSATSAAFGAVTGSSLNLGTGALTAGTGNFSSWIGAAGNGGGAGQNVTLKAGFGTAAAAGNLYLGAGRGNSGGTTGSVSIGVSQPTDAVGLDTTWGTFSSTGLSVTGSGTFSSSVAVGGAGTIGQLRIKQAGSDNFSSGLVLQRNSTLDSWATVVGTDNVLYTAYANNASGADAVGDFSVVSTLSSTGLSVTGILSSGGLTPNATYSNLQIKHRPLGTVSI